MWKAACKPASGKISRARTGTPPKSRLNAYSFLTARVMARVMLAVAVDLKKTTAHLRPLPLPVAMPPVAARVVRARRVDGPRAAMPSRVGASHSPWTTIWARPSLPKPRTWTTCRSRQGCAPRAHRSFMYRQGRGIIHALFTWQISGVALPRHRHEQRRICTDIIRSTQRQSCNLLLISGRVARQHSRALLSTRAFSKAKAITGFTPPKAATLAGADYSTPFFHCARRTIAAVEKISLLALYGTSKSQKPLKQEPAMHQKQARAVCAQ